MKSSETTQHFVQELAERIKNFRKFDDTFEPLSETAKTSMFKKQRNAGWAVLKKALLVVDREGRVMMFFRPPMDGDSPKENSGTPLNTYGLTCFNSILVYDQWSLSFEDIAQKRVQAWPQEIKIIRAGMSHAVVAGGYLYFFEIGYAIVPTGLKLKVGGAQAGFVELEDAMDMMNSHGQDSKEMEISIAKALSHQN